MQDLLKAALEIREKAYAPYSNFKVGAALRANDGRVFCGVNVENVAYPEGTCAEAGAIAAMIAAGATGLTEIAIIADAPDPVTPCGGCRQKLREFAGPEARVLMANLDGETREMTLAELLPGAFDATQLERS